MSNRLEAKHLAVTEPKALREPRELTQAEIIRQAEAARALVVGEYLGQAFNAIRRVFLRFSNAVGQARAMSELARLDDRTLADIGITRGDIPAYVTGRTSRTANGTVVETPKTSASDVVGKLAA